MATSGSFSTSAVGNFYFTFEWSRTGYNSSRNEHYIHYNVYAHNTPGNYRTVYEKNLWVNGGQQYYDTTGRQCYDGTLITSGDITVASYNSAGDGSFGASFSAGVGITPGSNCSGSGSWDLDRIPRYTSITSFSVSNISGNDGLTKVKFNWSASDACDWAWYSTDNGASWHDLPNTNIVSGLSPNTGYNFKLRVRRADSQLTTDSNTVTKSTYDIAKITNVPNIEHGNSLKVDYSNPSGASIEIGLFKTNGTTMLTGGYRACSGNSYTFNFTDQELDNIYKVYGYSNQITLRAYIKTAGNYTHYKEFTVTLKGNQKTAEYYTDEYKRAIMWVKKNKVWRKAVFWSCESTGWKRGI